MAKEDHFYGGFFLDATYVVYCFLPEFAVELHVASLFAKMVDIYLSNIRTLEVIDSFL